MTHRGAAAAALALIAACGCAQELEPRAYSAAPVGTNFAIAGYSRVRGDVLTDPSLPAMGMRFRLKRDYPIAGFPRQARIVLQALKDYGMVLADNGSNWFVSGAPDARWSNDQLHALHRVPGSAFEVVDTRPLR